MPYIRQDGVWVDILNTAPAGGSPADLFPSTLTSDGVTAGSSVRASVTATASATPHTVGSWVDVDTSLAADASGVCITLITVTNVSGADSSTLLDIGVDPAGGTSFTVWATVGIGYTSGAKVITVPGAIAAGTRVAIRVRSAVVSRSVTAVVSFITAKSTTFAAPVTYQANTATSSGLTITAPGSTNTKGPWTDLVAATASDIAAFCVCAQGAGGTNMNGSGVLVDIGVDTTGGTSFTVIAADVYYIGGGQEFYNAISPTTYGATIPAGSRIAARYASANANNAVDIVMVAAPPA